MGWLRISAAGGTGCFEVMFHPLEQEGLEHLVNGALASFNGKSSLFGIVFGFQEQLRSLLPRLDFEEVGQYQALVKMLAARVREPSFMPAQV